MLEQSGDNAILQVVTSLLPPTSMFMLAAQFPFQSVDDAFDAGLKDIGGDADGSPAVRAVGKNRQHPHQGTGAVLVVCGRLSMVQQTDVELFEFDLRELRVMFFQDLAHGVVNRMHRPPAVCRHQLLLSEDLDQDRCFGNASERFRRLEIDLIVDLAAQDAEGLQIVIVFANGHEFERRPGAVEVKKNFFQISGHESLQILKVGPSTVSTLYPPSGKWLEDHDQNEEFSTL